MFHVEFIHGIRGYKGGYKIHEDVHEIARIFIGFNRTPRKYVQAYIHKYVNVQNHMAGNK